MKNSQPLTRIGGHLGAEDQRLLDDSGRFDSEAQNYFNWATDGSGQMDLIQFTRVLNSIADRLGMSQP